MRARAAILLLVFLGCGDSLRLDIEADPYGPQPQALRVVLGGGQHDEEVVVGDRLRPGRPYWLSIAMARPEPLSFEVQGLFEGSKRAWAQGRWEPGQPTRMAVRLLPDPRPAPGQPAGPLLLPVPGGEVSIAGSDFRPMLPGFRVTVGGRAAAVGLHSTTELLHVSVPPADPEQVGQALKVVVANDDDHGAEARPIRHHYASLNLGQWKVTHIEAGGARPRAIVAGDFGGGVRVAAALGDSHEIRLFRCGACAGDRASFTPAGVLSPLDDEGSDPRALLAADLNGDSRLDLAVANHGARSVVLFLGKGDGQFDRSVLPATGLSMKKMPVALAAARLRGPGAPVDLIVVGEEGPGLLGEVAVLPGPGFAPGTVRMAGLGSSSVTVTDFDRDGHLDVVVANNPSGLTAYRGNGTGALGNAVPSLTNTRPSIILAGEFNHSEGRQPGLAVIHAGSTRKLEIYPLLPTGKVDEAQAKRIFSAQLSEPTALSAADFNRDGLTDLAVANGPVVEVFLGRQVGMISAGPRLFMEGPSYVVAHELNDDGRPDLAVISTNEQLGMSRPFLGIALNQAR